MIKKNIVTPLISLVLMSLASGLQSCAEKEEVNDILPAPESQFAISFGGDIAEEAATTTRADQPLNKDFIVYGYKALADGQASLVFPAYNVYYDGSSAGSSADNTHGYYYVNPDEGQSVKYWDYGAQQYRYWGYVKNADKITPSADGKDLTVTGLTLGITEPSGYLLSALKPVEKAAYGEVVQLRFLHPYAKVRVLVYAGANLEPGDFIELSKLSFGPNVSSPEIINNATVKVTYPLSGTDTESYSIIKETSTTIRAQFTYQGFDASSSGPDKVLKLTSENCTSDKALIAYPQEVDPESSEKSEFYYVLPTGTGVTAPDFKFQVCIDGDDEPKTAIVPSVYMHWKPNYQYTYIFKVLEGGLLFVDADITEWESGGSTSDQWTNW